MAAQNFGFLRSACRPTDLTVILADGSKHIGDQCKTSLRRAPLVIKRAQQVRRLDSELIKELSENQAHTHDSSRSGTRTGDPESARFRRYPREGGNAVCPTADLRPPRRSPSIEWKTRPVPRHCRPDVSAAALIARHVGLLHDAEEGASRVLKHNEVVSSTIPPGISSRSQSDQSLNFGLLVRGVEVEMKPPTAPLRSRPTSRTCRGCPAGRDPRPE